nr:unnamed protein product [Digitaria exilis]
MPPPQTPNLTAAALQLPLQQPRLPLQSAKLLLSGYLDADLELRHVARFLRRDCETQKSDRIGSEIAAWGRALHEIKAGAGVYSPTSSSAAAATRRQRRSCGFAMACASEEEFADLGEQTRAAPPRYNRAAGRQEASGYWAHIVRWLNPLRHNTV